MYSFKHLSTNPDVLILYFLLMLPWVNTLQINNHKLLYSKCSNPTSINPSHSTLLSSLFQEFIARSSQSKFSESIVADFDNNIAISGNYQCRNDLSPDECTDCIRKIRVLSKNVCGEMTPARIQLSGCHVQCHEENGNNGDEIDSSPGDILSKSCSEPKIRRNGFVEMKDAALAAMESGVVGGNGFCDAIYQGIHVVAQCAGYLGACDCGECVSNAVRVAGEEGCRFSVSGEIYLDSCSISYDYLDGGNRIGGRSSKPVAIVLGGLALLLLGLALCYFMRSCGKKEEDW